MKVSDPFYSPLVLPPPKTDAAQQKVPVPPGVMHTPNGEYASGTRDHGYPEASVEELAKRALRGGGFGLKIPKLPKLPKLPKIPKTPKTGSVFTRRLPYVKGKQKLPGGPNSPGNAAHNSTVINNLQSRGLFPPLAPGLAAVARNAIVEATLSGLVRLAFTPAEYAVSNAMEKRILAQAEMPGAQKKNADGTQSSVDSSATEQQKMDARVEGAEINVELLANSIIAINEGPDASAVGKSPNAPTTTGERLDNLEKLLDAVEGPLEDIAKRYGQLYTRPAASDSSEPRSPESRMDGIEQRYSNMNKMLKRLIAVKEFEAAEEAAE